MKKFMIGAVAALFMVMMVMPAYAADNLELSGQFRVRGWDLNNEGFVDDEDSSYLDQRMRVKAKMNVNDNIYAVIRADLGEGTWGQDFSTSGIARPVEANEVSFDRLYVQIDQEMYSLTLGEQYIGLGICEVLDSNPTAAKLSLNFEAVQPSLFYIKLDENGDTNDDDAFDDANIYGTNLSFALAGFDSNLFYAMLDDRSDNGEEVWGLGYYMSGAIGNLNLTGEIATLGGDDGAGTDYEGTQFFFQADMDVTETVNLGAEILYALGTDDADEAQVTNLIDWWTFTPFSNNTPGSADFTATGSNPFDPFGNAGVQQINAFAEINPMDKLSLGGKIGIAEPEEDDAAPGVDGATAFNVWAAYDVFENSQASIIYLHVMPDVDSSVTDDEDEGTIYAKFQVNF